MQFYTRKEAADAITAQLQPHDAELRTQVADGYFWRLYDALCAGELVGRDPTFRMPITPTHDLAGALAFGGCLISDTDLNVWLEHLGVGVVIVDWTTTCLTLPSDAELLSEKRQMDANAIRNAYVRLAAKYGVDKRRIKYLCEKAAAEQKKTLRAASSPFHSRNRGS